MAEIAGGAVRTLLGVIRDETNRLGHVARDVQFIKEEMESMSSFLMHLARTTPPGREHDEQVRTWMKQVRELAQDCSNSIDRYLRHRDPAVYRARSSLGYLWWVPWYLKRLAAQHVASSELRELKERARDVGERRQRYGVMVPSAPKAKQESGEAEAAEAPQPHAETFREDQVVAVTKGDEMYNSRRRALAFAEPRLLEKCNEKLLSWLKWLAEEAPKEEYEDSFPAIAIVAPDEEEGVKVVEFAADTSMMRKFHHKMKISLTPNFQEPSKILKEIINLSSSEVQSDSTAVKKVVNGNPIEEIEVKIEEHLQACTERSRRADPLDVLLDVLQKLLPKPEVKQEDDKWSNEKMDKKGHHKLEEAAGKELPSEHEKKQEEDKLEEAARKIKSFLEPEGSKVHLDHVEYKSILRQLCPEPKEAGNVVDELSKYKYQVAKRVAEGQTNKQQEAGKWGNKLGEDQIEEKVKETMEKVMAKMLLQLLPKHDEEGSGQLDEGPSHEEMKKKIKGTLNNVREQLLIEEALAEIKKNLEGKKTLIIIQDATVDWLEKWEKINSALKKMGCAPGSAAIVTTKDSQGGNKYCNTTKGHPIKYSFVGYYRDKAEKLTKGFVKEEQKSVFGEILKTCEPHEFCMKMFVCALYANPKRSMEDLHKLGNDLRHGGHDEETKAYKMIKFSYNELPRDYKTCLLYLAIFPPADDMIRPPADDMIIRRSRLVARWVVEGLIAGGDWYKSVRRAKQCFYELANRCLLRPEVIGVTGKAKSCTVHTLVHNFITEMAREEHITDARLSHNFARHFSIGSDIRLRPSESMGYFFSHHLSRASSFQFQLLKVLDLEGCGSLKENQKHLKNVCTMIILLKFLSLRNTDINRLPKEINKLQQLEVLDIRQTHLGSHAIKNLMLMKLKHLLAGTRRTDDGSSSTTIQMPIKTGQMTGLEVLSHVQAPRHHDILGNLWQLRKLGVVTYDCQAQLKNLLRGIHDLHECLQSLSIEIKPIAEEGVRVWCWSSSSNAAPPTTGRGVGTRDEQNVVNLSLLKSLRISGTTSCEVMKLLTSSLLAKGARALAKLTLENTSLSQDDMDKLLSKLNKLCSFKLHNVKLSRDDHQLTFKADKKPTFEALRYLAIKGGNIKSISFEYEAAPRLENIAWTFGFTEIKLGIQYLGNLQEVELNGDIIPAEVKEAMKKCPNANFKHNDKPLN